MPTQLRSWPAGGQPRRGGVSSFGIGGTNAHVVLEQAPDAPPSAPGRPWQLIVQSARQPAALEAAAARLGQHLRDHPGLDVADVAFTLSCGRRAFGHRRMLVCRTLDDAAATLGAAWQGGQQVKFHDAIAEQASRSVAFMFSGQGSQYIDMAAEIYRTEAVFRAAVDRCAGLLEPQLDRDLRDVIYPRPDRPRCVAETLKQTAMAQPALFVIEYALAQLWMSWGIRPDALIGHSLGELVAACVAGVWGLEDALALVALRAKLMQRQPTGAMLAVSLPEAEVGALLTPEVSLAAVNGPSLCVISGAHDAIARLGKDLERRDIACRILQTSHAFHSAMMEPVLEPLLARLREIECHPPAIPLVSNVTGTWITSEQAVDPRYWAQQLRATVRFADGLDTLMQQPERCLVEIGPGNTLAALALRQPRRSATQTVVTSLRHPGEQGSDCAHLVEAAGKLWLAGAQFDWSAFYAGQARQRLHLPTYAFQRQRYWIDPPRADAVPGATLDRKTDIGEWFYAPSWQRTPPPAGAPATGTHWLLLMDACGVGTDVAERLSRRGIKTTQVHAGAGFARRGAGNFVIDPGSRNDYGRLVDALRQREDLPDIAVHLWNVTDPDAAPSCSAAARDRSFHSLVFLAQALGDRSALRRCHIAVVSNRLHDVTGEERLDPIKALLLGPVTVIPQEYEQLTCSSIDLDLASRFREQQVEGLLADAAGHAGELPIAYRGAHRWKQIFVPAPLATKAQPVRAGGSYLITGGVGAVGLALAEWLARTAPGVKLALLSRSAVAAGVETSAPTGVTRGSLLALGDVATRFADPHERMMNVLAREAGSAHRGRPHGARPPVPGLYVRISCSVAESSSRRASATLASASARSSASCRSSRNSCRTSCGCSRKTGSRRNRTAGWSSRRRSPPTSPRRRAGRSARAFPISRPSTICCNTVPASSGQR